MTDEFGNAVTTDHVATVKALDAYAEEFLGYGANLPAIIQAADADPGCALVNAHAAIVHMALEAAKGHRSAARYVARAEAAAPRASRREQAVVAAARAWHDGRYDDLVEIHRQLAEAHPSDIVAAKWGQYHCFNRGAAEAMLRLAEAVRPAHEGTRYFQGLYAFALEQTGRLAEAEAAGRRAVEIEPADPWAHHAMAHVLESAGRTDEGLDWLARFSPTWAGRGVFIRGHNWWHVALLRLDRAESEEALRIFDERLWGEYPEFSQEQIGAISALWRFEMRAMEVGERWAPVAAKVREREYEHIEPFLDLHYLYALTRAGFDREASAFLSSLEAHAARVRPGLSHAWAGVAVHAARGVAAHARRLYEPAFEALNRVIDQMQAIGGSHAQRDLFLETWLDALVRLVGVERAGELVRDRLSRTPQVAARSHLLARRTRLAFA
ncbi:MAG: tetratricopeptide repeat protein [Alphaproteobacteria bacterium]|nr:tetratricopeptide repeat protein [Alphaproteobacteria bacterium]